MMKKTLEQKVADTILQHKVRVKLAGKEYIVAPPTMATLIEMSAHISKLPKFDDKSTILEMLGNCDKLEPIADVVATMIVGAKRKENARNHWWELWKPKDLFAEVRECVKNECTPQEINRTLEILLDTMQLKSFFVISVSLVGLNVTRATTETETTAFGQ